MGARSRGDPICREPVGESCQFSREGTGCSQCTGPMPWAAFLNPIGPLSKMGRRIPLRIRMGARIGRAWLPPSMATGHRKDPSFLFRWGRGCAASVGLPGLGGQGWIYRTSHRDSYDFAPHFVADAPRTRGDRNIGLVARDVKTGVGTALWPHAGAQRTALWHHSVRRCPPGFRRCTDTDPAENRVTVLHGVWRD